MIKEVDMWNCPNCEAVAVEEGEDTIYLPGCKKSGLLCETVLRYADEDCDLQNGRSKA